VAGGARAPAQAAVRWDARGVRAAARWVRGPAYRKRFPKAVETLCRDWERMVTFYRFPTAHWTHPDRREEVPAPERPGAPGGRVRGKAIRGRSRREQGQPEACRL